MNYALSEHMSFKKLLRAALPCIMMMVAISIYSVVDGFFVSNFAGKTPFAGLNLIYPLITVLGSLGFMMGTGGAAFVAKRFGEGKNEEGNKAFSNCVFFTIFLSVAISIPVIIFMPSISRWLGSDENMLPYCVSYGRISVAGVTFFSLQNLFQSFFTAAEKPRLGFVITLIAGITNIILDAILIVGFKLGTVGAAIGTISGQAVGAIIPIIYFARKNPTTLRLKWEKFEFNHIFKMAGNGASEFVSNISVAVSSMLINSALMTYYGEDGVSAYGIICYVWLIFAAAFIGYNIAVSPRVSYALGAQNKTELKSLFKKSMILLTIFGLAEFALAEALAVPLSYAFAGYDQGLVELTILAFRIYSLVFAFVGFNMFASAFFTALNNGIVSMIISFARLGLMELGAVLIVPLLMGGIGVWWAVPIANMIGFLMNLIVLFAFGKRYGYLGQEEISKNSSSHV